MKLNFERINVLFKDKTNFIKILKIYFSHPSSILLQGMIANGIIDNCENIEDSLFKTLTENKDVLAFDFSLLYDSNIESWLVKVISILLEAYTSNRLIIGDNMKNFIINSLYYNNFLNLKSTIIRQNTLDTIIKEIS